MDTDDAHSGMFRVMSVDELPVAIVKFALVRYFGVFVTANFGPGCSLQAAKRSNKAPSQPQTVLAS